MASALLRTLGCATRAGTVARPISRQLATSSVLRHANPAVDTKKTGFDYHTVEDLHGMTATEILTGPTEDAKMRHFTG
jgi:NADH dehydrogenase (ubiquinone) Fe-S protein 2